MNKSKPAKNDVYTRLTRQQALAQLTAPGQDYALESIELYGRACRNFRHGPQTLPALYASTCSSETFLVYEDERYSFADVYARSGQLAAALQHQYGIAKGDRVAISMRNYPEWVMSFCAITSIGAIAVAMNALWSRDEMEYGLSDSGARVLFADQERVNRLVSIKASLCLQVIAVRTTEIPENIKTFAAVMAAEANAKMPEVEVLATDRATILYTSGSTGPPKGAVSCHLNILAALKSWELDLHSTLLVNNIILPENDYQPAGLLAIPLFHVTGLLAVLLSSFRAQRKIVAMYKWNTEHAAELIEHEKIAGFIAPAAMTGELVETARHSQHNLRSLARVGGGGAPRAPEQVKRIAESFQNALPSTGWGMTETNAIGTGISGQDYLDHPDSSGRCSVVLDIKIVDASGVALPAAARGELLVRGTSIIEGYWNRPEANAETFVDGWLKTGDVAYLDKDGYVYIVDRIKDLVIRGGENIGCAEVEAALLTHDKILEASVYAVPDDRLGEEIGATIYIQGVLDDVSLKAFLLEHIARFKLPRYFQYSALPLPRIASGKIDKRRIRAQAVDVIQSPKQTKGYRY